MLGSEAPCSSRSYEEEGRGAFHLGLILNDSDGLRGEQGGGDRATLSTPGHAILHAGGGECLCKTFALLKKRSRGVTPSVVSASRRAPPLHEPPQAMPQEDIHRHSRHLLQRRRVPLARRNILPPRGCVKHRCPSLVRHCHSSRRPVGVSIAPGGIAPGRCSRCRGKLRPHAALPIRCAAAAGPARSTSASNTHCSVRHLWIQKGGAMPCGPQHQQRRHARQRTQPTASVCSPAPPRAPRRPGHPCASPGRQLRHRAQGQQRRLLPCCESPRRGACIVSRPAVEGYMADRVGHGQRRLPLGTRAFRNPREGEFPRRQQAIRHLRARGGGGAERSWGHRRCCFVPARARPSVRGIGPDASILCTMPSTVLSAGPVASCC